MTRLAIVPAKSSTDTDEPNQLRKAKLKRTKFVILSEAEGPAFRSRDLDINPEPMTCSGGHSERSEESQQRLIAAMPLEPFGHRYGCPRFAQLTWVSRKTRPFKGWQ